MFESTRAAVALGASARAATTRFVVAAAVVAVVASCVAVAERVSPLQVNVCDADETCAASGGVCDLELEACIDDPALVAALTSPAFYIGALGSRKTHSRRVERLTEAGFDDEALTRIHGPVGLDIGARTPGEIAAAILAQVIGELRRNVT